MPLYTLNATSNTTPDPSQGGSAVTGNTNTGHSATTSTVIGVGLVVKTCVWQSFLVCGGQIGAINLKVDWTEDGTISAGGTSRFRIQYSVNGGGAYTDIINHTNVTSPSGPTTATVALGVTQDITAVRVRSLVRADGFTGGDAASVQGTVSNIKLEVTVVDISAGVGM